MCNSYARGMCAFIVSILAIPAFGAAQNAELPVVDGQQVLATVNGEPVTADELRWRIGAMHQGMEAADGMVRKPDTAGLLDRLINGRLIVQEARQIGLDELPDVRSKLNAARKDLVKRMLIDERLKGIHEGDPDVVEAVYRETVKELRIRSALFPDAEDAAAFHAALRAGEGFEEAFAPFAESGTLTVAGGESFRVREIRPGIVAALDELEPGEVTAPLTVPGGVAVVRLLEVRYPDDPEARAEAEETALTYRKQAELEKYTKELRDRYAAVDEKVRDSLDFNAPDADIETFQNDERVVAKIKGGDPVTVKEVTRRLEQQLYHGMGREGQRERVNEKVPAVVERLVLERTLALEAKRLGIEEREEFYKALASREEGILFGAFVSRIVNPEIEISDGELQEFYNEHLDEYMTSEMIRLESIPFRDREHAEAGIDKLRRGSDLDWVRSHAAGRVESPAELATLPQFGGRVLAAGGLPDGVREAVAGASPGDYRLWAHSDAVVFVLVVQEVYPARPQEFAKVREQILRRRFVAEREEVVDRWAKELRSVSEIEVHASEDQIRTIVGLGPAEDG